MDLVMGPHGRRPAAAGRTYARWLLFCGALIATGSVITANPLDESRVDVRETGGLYRVTAAFAVSEPAHVVMAVLTDYARIPKFMPDVQVSKVLERTPTGAVVEQEAESRFMMFSKKVHLILDVREGASAITFRDRCGRSFTSYQGGWTITESDSLTIVDYELTARPSFDVPAFVLKRLLRRDASQLIDRIKAEIAAHEIR